MQSRTDNIALKDPFLDRRSKLLPCQREMVRYWYERGLTITVIALMFKVSRRAIQFVLFPEKVEEYKVKRAERGGSKKYYNTETSRIAIKEHRKYKKQILKDGSDLDAKKAKGNGKG
jgi:hypothetical protein